MNPEQTYEKASEELDQILTDLEGDTITIDLLAEKVERAGKLLTFCTTKLRTTEAKVNKIISDIGL
jgi:exodeoxyribonuclease VII small subunit